jgi:hypothetical protein
MRLNLNFRLFKGLSFFLITGQIFAINISEVPKEARKSFIDFLAPRFDETKALKEWSHVKKGRRIYHLKYPDDMDSPPVVGYCHKKNTKVFHAARTKDSVLFRAQYEFDSFRRRKVNLERRQAQQKHLILAGCSFAMGTSLSDNDTIGFHIARLAQKHYPVNLGVAGSGTNTMLAMTRNNLKRDSLFSAEGIFVYIFLDFHIPRANGFAMEREWLWDSPLYEKSESGVLINKGNFKEAEPIWTSFFSMGQAALRKLGLLFNYPKLSAKHIQYTCDLIKDAKRDYLSKFKGNQFVVYTHPYSLPNKELLSCLKESEVRVVKSQLSWGKEDVIPFDDHPNGKANLKIAKEIVAKLGL